VTSPGLFPHDGNARTNSLASPRLRRPQARQGCARRERTGRRTGARLGVDQDRGVAVTPAQGEVVDPEYPRYPQRGQRQALQHAHAGVPGDLYGQHYERPRTTAPICPASRGVCR
jgi:hypothetical protein